MIALGTVLPDFEHEAPALPVPAAVRQVRCDCKLTGVAPTPEQLQQDFYAATAAHYHEGWSKDVTAHHQALTMVSALIRGFGLRSILDVGAGTGRGVAHFRAHHPSITVRGVEPVRAMIDQAERGGGVPAGYIVEGRGQSLPFEDQSFDVVSEFGILHHVADPEAVVKEMTRVARRAVFLSDANRFAQGRGIVKAIRYCLYRAGLWPIATVLRTRGRGYLVLEGDGLVYSYSVYDSLPVLDEWADRIFIMPTEPSRTGWFHPLFTANQVLVCALRDADRG